MRDDQSIVLVLPRFGRWTKLLSIVVGAIWVAQIVLFHAWPSGGRLGPAHWLALIPSRVIPGLELWRVLTYPWIEDPLHFGAVWTILAFWLFGAPIERQHGPRRIAELLFAGTLGGAVLVLALSRLSTELYQDPAVGMAPVTSAMLAAWGFLYSEQPVSFFGLGRMKGRHLAVGLGALTVLMALLSRSTGGIASVGGLLAGAGWTWLRTRRPNARGKKPRRPTDSGRFRVVQGGRSSTPGDKRWLN